MGSARDGAFALSLVVMSLASSVGMVLVAYVGYGTSGLRDALRTLGTAAGALAAFVVLPGGLPWPVLRTPLALAAMPAAHAAEWIVERRVCRSAVQAWWSPGLLSVVGRTWLREEPAPALHIRQPGLEPARFNPSPSKPRL